MTRTALEIAAAVRDGSVPASEITRQALDRIADKDSAIGAFRVLRRERALAEAAAVDAHPDRSTLPLAGVPLAIKDNVPVAGESMRNGSTGSDPAIQGSDHEVVRRLRAAGAVVVGLSNVPELCVFGATDSGFGITRNPWNLDRSPGGSSGGSAAAVAAGLVPVAHGNDGMGSIRIPAACTGLVGIKPGPGIVPSELGNGSWFGMAENGPLATTVADCALLLSVMAGRPELAGIDAELASLRVGLAVKAPVSGLPVDREYAAAVWQTGDLLTGAGHRAQAAELHYPIKAGPAAMARWFAGAELDAELLANRSRLDPRTRRHARLGRGVLAAGGPRAGGRTAMLQAATRYFADFDVLITPALARGPLRALPWHRRSWSANVLANVRYAPFAAPWNLLGWPALVLPAGIGRDRMPLSVQLVSRPGQETLLLNLAAQLERLRPWPRLAPAYR